MSAWFPVEWSHNVKKTPLSVELEGIPIVLFRSNDKVVALLDRCSHRGAPLSDGTVRNGTIVCPYHGWCFSSSGTCVSVPGVKSFLGKNLHSVRSFHVQERYGLIWVCSQEEESKGIPTLEIQETDASFCLTSAVNAPLFDVIENALDPLHTHYIHAGLIRSESQRQDVKIVMRVSEAEIEAEYCNEAKQEGVIHKLLSFGHTVEKSYGRYKHPSLFQLEYRTKRGAHLTIYGFLSPKNEHCSKVFLLTTTSVRIPRFIFRMIVKPLFSIALKQDKSILEATAKHQENFQGQSMVSTKGDLFGPYLKLLKAGKKLPTKEYEVNLYV